MPTNKQGKVTGLRLTTEARAVLERVSSEGRFSQGDLVSALLEEHADNLDALEAKVAGIRDRRKVYADRGRNAAGLKKGVWSSYEETWHVNDREHHVVWTRGELEQFADRFLDYDYWLKWFDHWVKCNEADQKRLTDNLLMQLLSYPVPIRWRWLELSQVIMWEHFMVTEDDSTEWDYVCPPLEEMVIETFQDLPFPTENKFRGVVLGLTDQLTMEKAGEWNLGVVSNMFEPDDWSTMMEAVDTSMTILLDRIYTTEAEDGIDETKGINLRMWLGDKKHRVARQLNLGATPEERRVIQHNAAKRIGFQLGIQVDLFARRLLPQTHAAVFGDVQKVHSDGVKKFSVQDGPFPRSAALFRIVVALQIAKELDKEITVANLYAFAGVAKSQVSQLLKEWPMFFDRHSDENGPKRGGWIRLSALGYDYFTPQRCVSEGGIAPSYMSAARKIFADYDKEQAEHRAKHPEALKLVVDEPYIKWESACRHVLGDSD